MTSVSVERTCGADETLGSSQNRTPLVGKHSVSNEEMDGTLDSSWDTGLTVAEKCSEWPEDVVILSNDKAFLNVRNLLLEREKILSKLNFFSRKDLVLKAGVYAHYSIDGVARIVGK